MVRTLDEIEKLRSERNDMPLPPRHPRVTAGTVQRLGGLSWWV
jgi:hypothetical protein